MFDRRPSPIPLDPHPKVSSQLVTNNPPAPSKFSQSGESLKRDFGLGRSALVVDAVSEVTVMLSVLLTQSGYVDVTALSAHGALEAVRKHRFDVIISDIGMPEM